jgi:hypothetical protein
VKILTRMCTSLDGFVITADGLPVQLAFPGWDAGALGFYELQAGCDAVLMGRTTFEPALGSQLPNGTRTSRLAISPGRRFVNGRCTRYGPTPVATK